MSSFTCQYYFITVEQSWSDILAYLFRFSLFPSVDLSKASSFTYLVDHGTKKLFVTRIFETTVHTTHPQYFASDILRFGEQ